MDSSCKLKVNLNLEICVCCRFLKGCYNKIKNKNQITIKVLDDSS